MHLIRSRRDASKLLRCVTAAALVAAVLVGFGTSQLASADRDDPDCWGKINGKLVYLCGDDDSDNDDDNDNGGGGGGSGEEECELSVVEGHTNTHCYGEYACWANIPSALDEDEWPEERPDPDAVYIFRYCYDSDGDYYNSWWTWYVPGEPSITDEAWQAYGELLFPEFSLAFSPAERSLVDLETWFWVDGPAEDTITGTSAGGVVAIATPRHVEVDPGDSGGSMNCGWAVSEAATCTHTYTRASVDGPVTSSSGDPAYEARARLVFDIHFEFNGSPLELPGLPQEFATDWQATPVPVAEVQSVVTE